MKQYSNPYLLQKNMGENAEDDNDDDDDANPHYI